MTIDESGRIVVLLGGTLINSQSGREEREEMKRQSQRQ
jgi:hypothetical protein